jgi:hypothetical protein
MTLRAFLALALALLCGSASAAPPGTRPAPAKVAPPMTFYVVKGAPDACGRGCDSWIAVEGQIDSGAAQRFRKFLRQLKGRNLPFYFASPGGNLDQALAMGAMLREKQATARVARTVANECGFEAQDSDVCLKLKQSGRELHGELSTRAANCNSACPYLMLGATTREIAPDAVLAVHSPKVVVHFLGAATPTREMRAAATVRGLDRADRMLRSYIVGMGVDLDLLELARTIKFEDTHVLTREEIAGFGIDRRELAETPWIFESGSRGMVRKIVSQRANGDNAYRMAQWRLFCFSTEQFELDFQRPSVTSPGFPTILISSGGSLSQYFRSAPVRTAGLELWGLRMSRASLQALVDEPEFELTEISQAQDGRRQARRAKFSSEGLAGALDRLLATCPPAKPAVPVQAIGARESAAK